MCAVSLGKGDPDEVDSGKPPGVPGSAGSQPFTDAEPGTGVLVLVLFMCHSEGEDVCSVPLRPGVR